MVHREGKLKILFVSSGRAGDVGYVVRNQGESLVHLGLEVDYLIITPGLKGYIAAVGQIRRRVLNGKYDLVHAHYSLSAISASFAGRFPLVVSLMGSDAWQGGIMTGIIRLFSFLRWHIVIVKTQEMKNRLRLKKAYVIPNGVDTDRFIPGDMLESRKRLGISKDKKVILFIAGINRPEKNISLARESVSLLNDDQVELIHVHDAENRIIPYYLNAADLLLLTSAREGGVNVIKEALACNCPIVSTDVGDVRLIAESVKGCYITDQNTTGIAEAISKALDFGARTSGRNRIFELGLDSVSVAGRITDLYNSYLKGGDR